MKTSEKTRRELEKRTIEDKEREGRAVEGKRPLHTNICTGLGVLLLLIFRFSVSRRAGWEVREAV